MATTFAYPLTAAQIGTYFVGQYYNFLQQQPDFVHQFYSDASTMLRIDGNTHETASAMLQIHSLIMSLSFTGVEIKTAHSLESWNGGVLVIVSGSVQIKSFSHRRKFVQTFFLAPQEKGFFVLNDVFNFIDEEPIHHHHHPAVLLAQSNLDSKPSASTANLEPVSNYRTGEEIKSRECGLPAEENDPVDHYSFPDQQVQNVSQNENLSVENPAEESNGFHQNAVESVHECSPAPEDPVGEPQKHTYASIVAKRKSAHSEALQPSMNQPTMPLSDCNQQAQVASPVVSSATRERPGTEAGEEVSAVENEGEVKSVYVRNLPSTVTHSEIEEQFKQFGKIKPGGVVIRNRKDAGIYYAFVEFEDVTGVHSAVQASTIQISGHRVYIEERRANHKSSSRPGRRGRGRGRGNYQMDAPRGRFGAHFDRETAQNGGERQYRGFHRQHWSSSAPQASRNGQKSSDSTD